MAEELKEYKNIRFSNRIDSESNWRVANPKLWRGEVAFVNRGNNEYVMVLGTGDSYNMKDILSNLNTGTHDGYVFYPGPRSSGITGDIPPATATTVGGVKVGPTADSGLILDSQGNLKNAIFNGYDTSKECYFVDKLYIKNLEYDNQQTTPTFSGNTITLRYDNPAGLAQNQITGIQFDNMYGGGKNGQKGFIGFNHLYQLVISVPNQGNVPILGVASPNNTITGLVRADETSIYGSVVECSALNVVDGATESVYSPTQALTINITPPKLKINGQEASYNAMDREYNVYMDGGLTPENAEKLARLEQSLEDIETLKQETIVRIMEGSLVKVTDNKNRTYTIDHQTIKMEDSTTTSLNYIVDSLTGKTEVVTLLSDIEVDDYGHIKKKHFKSLSWTR